MFLSGIGSLREHFLTTTAILALAASPLSLIFTSAAEAGGGKPEVETKDASVSVSDLSLPRIPYEKFVLPNGLRVIVHTDRKVPIIAVNVWYHVGSKDEQRGKTGFAHLFEHLMFNGTENYPGDFFEPFQQIGATDQNGTTNSDRTNYFQNVPTHALDIALWMESDRMGHFLGALTQEVLDEQRGVVKNEKRQGENQPYGRTFLRSSEATYPHAHPYSWSVIGSMEDLDAASLEDAKRWFGKYYGPNNAVLVLAGDIDVETAKRKAMHYFGDIPPGPENIRAKKWIAKRTEPKREIMYDNVPQIRIVKIWNTAEYGSEDSPRLELLANMLANGDISILDKRLIRDEKLATAVSAFYFDREISGQFWILVDVKEGEDPDRVERILDEELAQIMTQGLEEELLETVRIQFLSSMIRNLQRVGGFGGKSDRLAQGEVYLGDPEAAYKLLFEGIRDTTAVEVRDVARKWLTDGDYTLRIVPEPRQLAASDEQADRSALPTPGSPPVLRLPTIQRAQLDNGIKLVVVERHEVPVVNFGFQFNAGFHTDEPQKSGLASFAMQALIDGGTEKYSTLELDEVVRRLGASLGVNVSLDTGSIGMSTLKATLAQSMALLAEVVRNPDFDAAEIELLRSEILARIEQEKAQPTNLALRVLPALIYGDSHPYGKPLTGSGKTESIKSLTVADLRKFHQRLLQPENATLIAIGDATLDEVRTLAETHFGNWETTGEFSSTRVSGKLAQVNVGRIYLLDKPGALQSTIIAGQLLPPAGSEDELATQIAIDIIGGGFTSRLNMNLREDKHWSYGARAGIVSARGPQLFYAIAPVQSDKTIESIREIQREFNEYLDMHPATDNELENFVNKRVLEVPGRYETLSELGSGISAIVRFDRPDDHLQTLPKRLRDLYLSEVQEAAVQHFKPENWVWVIVGDREKLEKSLRQMQIGSVEVLSTSAL